MHYNNQNEQVYRWPTVAKLTGISRSTCWRLMKDGDFPPSIRLSSRAVGWKKSDIDKWLATRRNNSE